jgi:lactoylglutathione lyase
VPVRWTHVVLKVADLDRSVAFYAELCALVPVLDRRPTGGSTVWMGPPGPAGTDPAFVLVLYRTEIDFRLDHLGFQCDTREEVDGLAAEARRRGALVHEPIDGGGHLGYFVTLRDPDGHKVEFTHGQRLLGLGPG